MLVRVFALLLSCLVLAWSALDYLSKYENEYFVNTIVQVHHGQTEFVCATL